MVVGRTLHAACAYHYDMLPMSPVEVDNGDCENEEVDNNDEEEDENSNHRSKFRQKGTDIRKPADDNSVT